jgi:hypothetical protein
MFDPKRVPVADTGKSRGRCFRHVRTFAEHRSNQAVDRDEPPARPARGHRLLPNLWDDVMRTVERSWKAHRKTRWR